MNIIDLINKKRLRETLNSEELQYIIDEFTNGNIKDYQMSSLLMAICINDMTDVEVINLTKSMLKSGKIVDLSSIDGIVVDKHSTGGVGDKTSLIVCSIASACGVSIAKMSGRGLGHTGGTIDKLESIPGFVTDITESQFIKQVNSIKIAITSQTKTLVLADRKIYELRDVTGTVFSIPLIAASIMSKKIASNADKIVIDVKVGSGALVTNLTDAKRLSKLMIKIGKEYNKEVVCVLTNMDQPLGQAVGNSLEIMEAIRTLDNNGPDDLKEISIVISSLMVSLGKNISSEAARILVEEKIHSKEALKKCLEMIKHQQGEINKLTVSNRVYSIKSKKTGWITKIDALKIGELARDLGAGRITKDDKIDHTVGFVLHKKIGDYVLENEELVKVYYNEKDVTITEILDCFEIDDILGDLPPLMYEIIR